MVGQLISRDSEETELRQAELPEKEIAVAAPADVVSSFKTDLKAGLDESRAQALLSEVGRNEIDYKQSDSPLTVLLRQFKSSVVLLLLIAAAISFCTQDHFQAIGILAAVFINAGVGYATEIKAQLSLSALQQLSGPVARVIRSSQHKSIPAAQLVPGDIVVLEAGSRIPADLRLVEAAALQVDESVLTGESVPVAKSSVRIEGENQTITLGYHGTHVLSGRARGVVIHTGKSSSLGKLQCSLLEGHTVPTPLEVKLEELGKQLSVLIVVVCVLIAGFGLFKQHDVWSMLQASIALAVAAIPEGLPVVATLALAIGTQRMVRAGALIRKLSAVETLGCTTVICSDKTGTLTENKLLVSNIFIDGRHLQVSGSGYTPEGCISENGKELASDELLSLTLTATTLCNDARLVHNQTNHEWQIAGDPTEGALLVAAVKAGLDQHELRELHPRITETPFDLIRKKMATVHRLNDRSAVAYIKGSPERVIEDSTFVETSDGPVKFTEALRAKYLQANSEFAQKGLRVLGVAMKNLFGSDFEEQPQQLETEMTFLGLIAMRDLPRQGVNTAIAQCQQAGIKVMMLTGDQAKTARSIAEELGIHSGKDVSIISGDEMERMDRSQLGERLASTDVLARVTPELKLDVVKALQARGNVVAMTGDGVNDAPALQQANIGVAMGMAGTDLAREASNMVITDDNFSTIVKAIEQGRVIYDNIRRSICYLLTGSVASVITIAAVMISSSMLALNPLQLLWLNLIMHVFPGLGIVLQGAAPGTMQRRPRDPSAPLLGKFEHAQILVRAVLVSASVLYVVSVCSRYQAAEETTTTIAFATISCALLYQAWSWLYVSRDKDDSRRAPINKIMYMMMLLSYLLVVVAIYAPPLQMVLKTVSLDAEQWALVFIASTGSLLASIAVNRLCMWVPLPQRGKEK